MCAYSVSAIRDIFNEGKFKTPVAVETSHVKWVMYTGEVPVPRPGAVSQKTWLQPEVATALFEEGVRRAVIKLS